MSDRYLIVGLGNPGRDYEKTRHNIGFRAVEAIAAAHGLSFARKQAKAQIADGLIADKKVLLAKPQTYMNLSGESVRGLVDFYKIPLTQILVISDDMDLPLGTLRIRPKGSAGGQKGLKSILEHLGTHDVPRLRVGIGRPPGRMDPAAWVLTPFEKADEILLIETLDRVVKAVQTWLRDGLEAAMNRHNGTAEEAAQSARSAPAAPTANKPPTSAETCQTQPKSSGKGE